MQHTRLRTTTREIPASSNASGKGGKGGLFRDVDSLLANEGPLDEQDQEQLVADFAQIQLKQARTWRVFFGLFSALLATLYLHAAWSQSSRPWELKYVGEFQSVVKHGPAVAVLLLQASALAACALGLLMHIPAKGDPERGCMPAPTRQRLCLWTSLLLSACGAAFWGAKLHEMHTRYGKAGDKWELAWVPLAPLLCCSACLYVASTLEATAREVSRLRDMRYRHKTI